MKNITLLVVPVLVVILLLGGVVAWRILSAPKSIPTTQEMGALPNGYTSQGASKPSNAFSALFGPQTTPIPTPTPASVTSMNTDLQSLGDDGGAADFTSLQSQVSGL